jgi:protein-S-isoprenylcysteine O-methyltransferase Ste14
VEFGAQGRSRHGARHNRAFVVLATGQALAFGSWPAFVILLFGIVPTFAWRARAEEKLLSRAFGERYAVYQERTKMIIPYLL